MLKWGKVDRERAKYRFTLLDFSCFSQDFSLRDGAGRYRSRVKLKRWGREGGGRTRERQRTNSALPECSEFSATRLRGGRKWV